MLVCIRVPSKTSKQMYTCPLVSGLVLTVGMVEGRPRLLYSDAVLELKASVEEVILFCSLVVQCSTGAGDV